LDEDSILNQKSQLVTTVFNNGTENVLKVIWGESCETSRFLVPTFCLHRMAIEYRLCLPPLRHVIVSSLSQLSVAISTYCTSLPPNTAKLKSSTTSNSVSTNAPVCQSATPPHRVPQIVTRCMSHAACQHASTCSAARHVRHHNAATPLRHYAARFFAV